MKTYLLVGLATWTVLAGYAHGQAMLGEPIASPPHCKSCAEQPEPRLPLCHAGLGLLARGMMAPLRLATGTLMPPRYVETVVSKEEVARMTADGTYSPAEMAAAKIKLDEAQAKTRSQAVRYLATVNGHYYPEAEAGLIAALRADRNECVRLEAALALGTCPYVTNRIADALRVSATGSETDGNPAEISPRVRSAAREALNRCQAQGLGLPALERRQMLPPPDFSAPAPLPSQQPLPAPLTIQPSAHVALTPEPASADFLAERTRAETVGVLAPSAAPAAGPRTLYQFFRNAVSRESNATNPNETPAAHPLGLLPIGTEVNPFSVAPSRYNH